MARPRHDLEFGSDSFLDVIANVVGILIILLVIAGLRAGQSPSLLSIEPVAADQLAEMLPSGERSESEVWLDEFSNEPAPEDAPEWKSRPEAKFAEKVIEPNSPRELEYELPPAPVAQDEIPELNLLAEELERSLREATRQQRILSGRMIQLRNQQHEISSELQNRELELKDVATKTAEVKSQRKVTEDEVATLTSIAVQLQEEFERLGAPPSRVIKLEHRITPISQLVQGEEIHFQVLKGRVVEIPLNDLVQRVKDQLERRREWLLKVSRYDGRVEPYQGFGLKYVVERQSGGIVNGMVIGGSAIRISVTQWEVFPEHPLIGETVNVALAPGSEFHQALIRAKPKSMLTFWVYPDSFEEFRKLQTYARQYDFLIAGRPLPEGVPISGSPNGSKSAGQ